LTAAVRPLITLLTDFGTRDVYVASLKGVILSLNPEVNLVDLSHEVDPQDIRAGALMLAEAAAAFPPGAIHLAVVDPGVGSRRRALAARCRGHYWVGPDNGLFHLIFRRAPDLAVVSLENPAYFRPRVSATFHGRDIFAPVAAHLSLGVGLDDLGPRVTDPVSLTIAEPEFGPEVIRGEIVYVDRFGNLVSNLPAEELTSRLAGRGWRLQVKSLTLRTLARTYADAAPGEFLALAGSHGCLEIACAMDHAAARLHAGVGLAIEIRLAPTEP
jgi:S-adenosyl-L-methionine hydrolase (adenosine-forming)